MHRLEEIRWPGFAVNLEHLPGVLFELRGGRRAAEAHAPVADHPRHHRQPDSGEEIIEVLAVDVGLGFLDVMAEAFTQRGDVTHRALAIGVHRRRRDGLGAEGDAQTARIDTDFRGERAQRRRREIRRAEIGAGGDVEHQRVVQHSACDHVFRQQTGAADITVFRAQRIASARGLEADQAAHRGRNAGRTATVIGVRYRHHTRRHCRTGTARRTTRRARQIPGIARCAVELGFGGRLGGELRCIGLTNHDEAGAAIARY